MDSGSFVEYDMFVEHTCTDFGMDKEKVKPLVDLIIRINQFVDELVYR